MVRCMFIMISRMFYYDTSYVFKRVTDGCAVKQQSRRSVAYSHACCSRRLDFKVSYSSTAQLHHSVVCCCDLARVTERYMTKYS